MQTIEYTPLDEDTKQPLVEGGVFLLRPANGRKRILMRGELMKASQGQENMGAVLLKICADHCVGWRGLPIPDYAAKAKDRLDDWEVEWIEAVGMHIATGCPTSPDPAGNSEGSFDA